MRESPRKMKLWNLKEEALDFPPHNYRKKREDLKKKKKNFEKGSKRKMKRPSVGQAEKSQGRLKMAMQGYRSLFISVFLSLFGMSLPPSPKDPHVPSFLNSWETRAAVSHTCPVSSTCQTWLWHPKCCVCASQLSTRQAKRSGYKSFKGRWPHHWSYQNRTQAPSPTSKVTSALR